MTDIEETIVAVSSAQGPGARAIVRLSGPNALDILSSIFLASESLTRMRRRWQGSVQLPGVKGLVPADLCLWVAPRSYTGQDLAELHVLSSPPLVELLLAELMRHGARAARPGELTLRGFLAGKLDLTRAEAVQGIVSASGRAELKQALAQLAGGVARPLADLRADLLDLRADVEAGLDFSEEDLQFVGEGDLLKRLAKALAQVTLVGKQLEQRGMTERPFRIVLAGRPNAGKSSLFNALGGGKALVSPEAGTTRDYLVQRLEIHGVDLELVDTAGRRRTAATLERGAQALGREEADRADWLLVCVPAPHAPVDEDRELLERVSPEATLVLTMADRGATWEHRWATSAKTGVGLAELRDELAHRARAWARPALAPSLSRCRHHVAACLDRLRRAHAVVLEGEAPEILAMELGGALEELGAMAGEVYTDDLLDRVFSRFCIGK